MMWLLGVFTDVRIVSVASADVVVVVVISYIIVVVIVCCYGVDACSYILGCHYCSGEWCCH